MKPITKAVTVAFMATSFLASPLAADDDSCTRDYSVPGDSCQSSSNSNSNSNAN